jgi:hypothetical protein
MSKDIFNSEYVGQASGTATSEQASEVKKFLKDPVVKQDMNKYGSSKPRRVVIKAKIKND